MQINITIAGEHRESFCKENKNLNVLVRLLFIFMAIISVLKQLMLKTFVLHSSNINWKQYLLHSKRGILNFLWSIYHWTQPCWIQYSSRFGQTAAVYGSHTEHSVLLFSSFVLPLTHGIKRQPLILRQKFKILLTCSLHTWLQMYSTVVRPVSKEDSQPCGCCPLSSLKLASSCCK